MKRFACLAIVSVTVLLAGCKMNDDGVIPPPPPNIDDQLGCAGACHGDPYSIAPPGNLAGEVDTNVRTVGAHRSHLLPTSAYYLNVQCSDCHVVPQAVGDLGHIDGDGTAELTFGPRATNNGQLTPAFDGTRCSNTYCHGSAIAGGAQSSPEWTAVTGQNLPCGTCHGAPPPPPHADDTDCGKCHPNVQAGSAPNYTMQAPDLHIDGKVDTLPENQQQCWDCHGSENYPNPPRDLEGNTDYTYPGVGAHVAHTQPGPNFSQLYCSQCHVFPTAVDAPGHIDGDGQAELTFDGLNPEASYDRATGTCNNVYCHSNGRGDLGTMTWTQDLQLGCDDCHQTNDPEAMSGKHDKHTDQRDLECYECHRTVVDAQRSVIGPQFHVNGLHDVYFLENGTWDAVEKTCDVPACHNVQRSWYGNGNND